MSGTAILIMNRNLIKSMERWLWRIDKQRDEYGNAREKKVINCDNEEIWR